VSKVFCPVFHNEEYINKELNHSSREYNATAFARAETFNCYFKIRYRGKEEGMDGSIPR